MLPTFTNWVTVSKRLLFAAVLAGGAALPAAAQTAYGLAVDLTGTYRLATFQASTPGTFTATVPITGLASRQVVSGIDVRPATGQLYALGYNSSLTTNNAQLYTLAASGALTAVGSPITLALCSSTTRVGFDFNPAADLIRVTGSNGNNYRLSPTTGAIAGTDSRLAYATTDANAGQTPGVGSVAYTNSYAGSTSTTLYDLDEDASRLVRQDPPNTGTLNTVATLGVAVNTAGQISDLDIYVNPTTGQNVAYLSVSTTSYTSFTVTNRLYTLNLTTGAATLVGTLGSTSDTFTFTDLALSGSSFVPAPVRGQLVYGLAGTSLVTFDSAVPGTIRSSVALSGVAATQTLVGLDVRPLTNSLYGLGYNAAAAAGVANAQVYAINATTGVASSVGAAVRLELGTGAIAFDFNPAADRIRVVGGNRNNYRLNPTTGAIAATDGTVFYPSNTPRPNIGAVAYTNSFSGATTSTSTTLYDYDLSLNTLNIQTVSLPPLDGTLTRVGASGITVNTTTPNVDLDIYSPAAGTNTAYLVANTGTSLVASLYTVNLATGAATLVGTIGNNLAVRNIAVAGAAGVVTGTRAAELATELTLFPNPLAEAATLRFGLPRAAQVELLVTDALGRLVDTVDAGQLPAGPQTLRWSRGTQAAGLYFFRLRFDGQPAGTRTATLLQ